MVLRAALGPSSLIWIIGGFNKVSLLCNFL